ncbi:MAG: tetratricopeptide repeat protein, partial [Chloroflexi bacterium]
MAVAQQEIEQAQALARQGNSPAAITLLSKLIQVEAGNAQAWLALAQVVEEPDRI